MEQLPWPLIQSGGGWAAFMVLAFLVLRAVVKGDWIPRSTHERELKAANHDRDEWRTHGQLNDQVINVKLDHIDTVAQETGRTLHHFLGDLQKLLPLRERDE